jgi:hypothetical protein
MKKVVVVLLFACGCIHQAQAGSAASRIESAATVLTEIMSAPDKGIPEEILGSAKCVAVVPSLLKGGFIFGGAHGRGVATCRTADGWTAPAPFSVTGGSFGLQIGVQGVDLVMLVMLKVFGRRCLCCGRPRGTPCRGRNRLEDARRSAYLFPRPRPVRRTHREWSRHPSGRRCYPGVIWEAGAV